MSRARASQKIDALFAPGGELQKHLKEFEHRAEQVEVANVIEEAFTSPVHCMVEAGTGVGKTMAYLIPAIRAIGKGKTVVISTHTISLQEQLISRDIPLAASLFPEVDVTAAVMKGRGNYLCKQDLDSAEDDIFMSVDPTFTEVKKWARRTETGDIADLPFKYDSWFEIAANADTCRQKECNYYDNCFYYKVRRAASDANLIVVNHALFLTDLIVRKEEPMAAILPNYDYVVLDEAHHLEDVATRTFGLEIGNREIPRLIDRVKRTKNVDLNPERLAALDSLNEQLFGGFQSDRMEFFFDEALNAEEAKVADSIAGQMLISLEAVQKELMEAAKAGEGSVKDRLNGLARTSARLREGVDSLMFGTEPNYIRWGQTGATRNSKMRSRGQQIVRTSLYYTPIQVGPLLAEQLWSSVGSVVLTSATLSNSGAFSYLRQRLGLPDSAIEKVVGSPFDYKSNAILYVPGDLPAPPKVPDDRYTQLVADEIERIINLTEGRAFVLFTSRRALTNVHELLESRLPYPIFLQGSQPPGMLVDAFRRSGNGCLFGLATFWEGVWALGVPGSRA
ncbi:MAG: DEAD/DEAH box helicase, partial [Chthonomonadales bacterium]